MKTRLLHLWDSVRASYWFVPTLFAASSLFLSAATLAVDGAANRRTTQSLGWMYHGGPDGARALLSTVAGSMIGIAGVTFSVTIVALSLASGQFGPRLLRNFMRDTGNQVVLGTFVATFLYCLLILRAVQGMDGDIFVPHVSVTFGLGLAVVSVGVLIYFFHHVAESIQADNIIAAVGRDLHDTIDRLFLVELGRGASAAGRPKATADIPSDFDQTARHVLAPTTGYIQAIDIEGLIAIARENDLVLWLKYRPGDFVPAESEMALARPGERLPEPAAEKIQASFILGTRRTPVQDVEFAVNQLVEVALRALSPGINDPFTAMTCVDWLGAGLCRLAERETPSSLHYDDAGKLRAIANATTFAGIVDAAFNQIRQAAQSNVAVIIRLLETIALVVTHARSEEVGRAATRHAIMIRRDNRDETLDEWDRNDIEQRYQAVMRALEHQDVPSPTP